MDMRQAPRIKHWIHLVAFLCGAPVYLSADSNIAVHVSQTVSAPGATGWRVVESLRIEGPGVHTSTVEQSSDTESGLRVILPAHSVNEVTAVDTLSSLFKTVRASSSSDGIRLDISFSSIETRRHCIFDTMSDLLFIVCTQEFPVQEAVGRVPVHVTPLQLQRPAELGAANLNQSDALEPALLEEAETVPVGQAGRAPLVSHEPLYAFAPLPQEPAVPRRPDIQSSDATVVAVPLAQARTLRPQHNAPQVDRSAPIPEAPLVHVKRVSAPRSLASDAEPALQAIHFDSQKQKLTMSFSRRPHYSLHRTGPDSYKLVVLKVGAAHPGLLLPFFAPADFPGVTVVRAQQKEDAIRFDIQIDRSASLRAVADPAGVSILVQ